MTSAFPTFISRSAIRPSMKLCFSRAAWYSAFSERSPWARASAIALVMACRSTRLSRSSSSRSFSKPGRVIGVRWTDMALTLARARERQPGSAPPRRGQVRLDLRVGACACEPGLPGEALLLGEDLLLDLDALRLETTHVGQHALQHLEHVVALLRLDRGAQLAGRRLERRQHRVARQPVGRLRAREARGLAGGGAGLLRGGAEVARLRVGGELLGPLQGRRLCFLPLQRGRDLVLD